MLVTRACVSRPRAVNHLCRARQNAIPIFSWKLTHLLRQYSLSSIEQRQWQPSNSDLANSVVLRTYATKATTKKTTKKTVKAKKSTPKKTTKSKKVKTKKQTVKKAKKKPVKEAKKRPVKKPLTPEEKTHQQQLAAKKEALTVPRGLPSTVFTVIASEIGKKNHGIDGKAAASQYKSLSPSEMESYNQVARENKRKNEEAYQKWVETYSVDEIRKANNARHRIRRFRRQSESNVKVVRSPVLIKDHRTAVKAKKPVTGYLLFASEKRAAGDVDNIKVTEAAKLMAKEWRALTDSEKKRYSKPT
ncbi:MAG: hypothetical protein M1814_002397 [Vezdaea aestivalis]|nr:MAG: hypothetical protein M1814_002397 [Vezdaea aestivalis]